MIEGEFVLSILRDIVQAMRFLHDSTPPIIHGDLKSASVYIDSSKRAKIKYLGLQLSRSEATNRSSLAFMSPELLTTGHSTISSDVYAFGVLLFEICSRQDPYENEDLNVVLNEVVYSSRRPSISQDWPLFLRFLMTSCWKQNPAERPHFDDVYITLKREGGILLDSLQSDLEQTEQKFKRAFDALKDIFPAHVADALAHGRPVESIQRDNVTIFFSDIVGYTAISSEMHANKVVDMLNRLYQKLDLISDELGVFKVETIGKVQLSKVKNMYLFDRP